MSFYQTYRPKKISELDLSSVREVLTSSLLSGTISHAYLLVGPRGSGKTSTARIMAQIINCKENQGKTADFSEPCGVCEACQVISRGSSVDVIEIDAASNGLVDDIRELRERVRLAPSQLPKKVYIIDEVHMVSTAGFNALLKTLEEPPEHALFILCTTESQKVPETIVSRCARINFTKATVEEVMGSLMKAVKGEGITADEEIVRDIAEATDGSFREGHKLLEQISAFGKKIDRSILAKILGTTGKHSVKKLLSAAVSHNTDEVIQTFEEMEKVGTKAPILAGTLLGIAKTEMENCVRGGNSPEIYLKLIDSLILASDRIKISPLPLLPLEIALLSICVDGQEGVSRPKVQTSSMTDRPVLEKKLVEDQMVTTSSVIDEKVEVTINPVKIEAQGIEVTPIISGAGLDLDAVKTGWGNFLNFMSENNGSLAGMLRLVQPVYVEGKSMTLSVTSRFQQEMLEREVKKKIIEEQMARVWGPMTFKCVLTDKIIRTQPTSEDENISPVTGGVDTVRRVMSAAEEIFG